MPLSELESHDDYLARRRHLGLWRLWVFFVFIAMLLGLAFSTVRILKIDRYQAEQKAYQEVRDVRWEARFERQESLNKRIEKLLDDLDARKNQ